MYGTTITGIGSYVPERKLTNVDLEQMVDTSDEWIVTRTGIKERRMAAKNEFTSHLAIAAVQNMIDRYGVSITDVDLILVCTHTPDFPFPSVACLIQRHFRIEKAGALDINATCAGFVYGMTIAESLLRSGTHRKVLIIASDTMSKIVDYSDRSTCILFGDGAGVMLLEQTVDMESSCIIATDFGSDGQGGALVHRAGLANSLDGIDFNPQGYFYQNGREVYRWAVQTVPAGMRRLLDASELKSDAIDWFVPHSANFRIIESICERSGFPLERTLLSLIYFGNTSAASIPLAIDLGVREGRVKRDNRLLLYGFGGGLVYAGAVIRWSLSS
ncbi:ketoacyl-ACP synthase III [Paenibacillus sp. TRM 82003]|nr:ketoacyl-ACP synthase III [Paenibacillus sp. TRM 82003]